MTLLLWQLGGLVLAVLAVIVLRELTRPRPLYLPQIANTKPPTVALDRDGNVLNEGTVTT